MENVYNLVGKSIRSLRTSAGVTQVILAERADISVSFLSFLESGKKKGSLETYAKLAKGLRVELKDLFDGRKNGNGNGKVSLLDNLSKKQKTAVLHIIRSMKKKSSSN